MDTVPGPVAAPEPESRGRREPDRPPPPPFTPWELVRRFWERWQERHPSWDSAKLVLAATALLALAAMAWSVVAARRTGAGGAVATTATTLGVADFATTSTSSAPSTTVAPDVVVDVAGAVRHPGPVRVAADARVQGAIAAAGGPSAAADLERVDRAAPLRDGQRIYVPRNGQTEVPQVVGGSGDESGVAPSSAGGDANGTSAGQPIDLNTATADQLETLSGVGPATAQAIIDYRTAHGRFGRVDDLLDVRGIGPAKLATLRPLVTV